MAKYEMLYILDAATTDEVKDNLIAKVEGVITTAGGVIEKTEKVGLKKLAYPINRETEGFYVVTTFEVSPTIIVEIKRVCGITEGIVRRLITRV